MNSMRRILVYSMFVCGLASIASAEKMSLPRSLDLPPDATSEDYQRAMNEIHLLKIDKPGQNTKENDGLDQIVAAGEKNLRWLVSINSAREAKAKLSFTDAQHRIGYPIDKANKYSPTIVLNRYNDFMAALKSEEFRAIVTGQKPITNQLPSDLTVEAYLDLGRTLDRIYQTATRWRMMQPYLPQMAANANSDVRGYYFLTNLEGRDQKLSQLNNLPADQQSQISEWLVSLCRNSGEDQSTCTAGLESSNQKENGNMLSYYNQYIDNAKTLYDSYFRIPAYGERTDIVWAAAGANEVATIPFVDPATDPLRNFMLNVEDEWHMGNWQLKLNFVKARDNTPHLTFQPGTTPHVNALGGNIITMDENTPLTDWENNWTIRHEFGHVLGFPDCYVEFYDVDQKVMINYQLDMTNLMCSRKGNLKETHKIEMTRVYKSK